MSCHANPELVGNGLVLCLDAANSKSYPGTGTAWNDISGHGFNATTATGMTYQSTYGGNFAMDGSTGQANGSITGSIFTGNFTNSAWFYKTNNNTIWQGVFTNSVPAVNYTYLMTFGNGSAEAPYNSVGSNQVGVLASGIFLDIGSHLNQWLYVAITKTNSLLEIYCYKAGALLYNSGTITWNSGNFATSNSYLVGRHWNGGSVVNLAGNVAQTLVYDRALSSSEITQNFQALRGRFGV